MSDQHKWCAFAKQNLFSGGRLRLENKLKENVIYRRSYALRPTVRLKEKASDECNECNESNENQTNINNHKEAKNICIETTHRTPIRAHLSPQLGRSPGLSSGPKSNNIATKPVIDSKPRAMNRVMAQEVDPSEGKAPDVWHRNARSASLPAIAVRLNRQNSTQDLAEDTTESNNGSDNCDDKQSSQVMDQIRRRVSQIIESDVLAVKQKSETTADTNVRSRTRSKQKKNPTKQRENRESDKPVKKLEDYIEVTSMGGQSAKGTERSKSHESEDRSRAQRQESDKDLRVETHGSYDWNLDDFQSNDGLSEYLSERIKRLSTEKNDTEEEVSDRMARIAKRIRLRYLSILAKDSIF